MEICGSVFVIFLLVDKKRRNAVFVVYKNKKFGYIYVVEMSQGYEGIRITKIYHRVERERKLCYT